MQKQSLLVYYHFLNAKSCFKIVILEENNIMKNYAITLVWATTLFVFAFALLCQTDVSYNLLMGLLLFGFLLIPYMVYTVLTDDYTTTKTFQDWYED